MNSDAVANVSGCLPLLIPTDPRFVSVEELLESFDGFLLTGGRPNVHPQEYGEDATEAHGDFDRARDAITLPLVRACVERGQPFLGICRGFQEVNVAMGGTLYPEIRDLPGRMNHRMPPDGTIEEKFALRHPVRLREGGVFHQLLGAPEVMTNTLHGQGIKAPGARIVIDGEAEDGTPKRSMSKMLPDFRSQCSGIPNIAQDRTLSRVRCLRPLARLCAPGRRTIALCPCPFLPDQVNIALLRSLCRQSAQAWWTD